MRGMIAEPGQSGQFGASGGAERAYNIPRLARLRAIQPDPLQPATSKQNSMLRKIPDQKPGTLRCQDWFDNPDKPMLDH
jgi:hypothetical protein